MTSQKTKNNKESSRTIPSDVKYSKEVTLEDTYNGVVLFSSSTYKFNITVKLKLTIKYPIISLNNAGAASNLSNAGFIKPQ